MDTYDSITLARRDREKQGPLEAEYSYGGEADLHRHFDECEKNLGHKNFIPVGDFNIKHLPVAYQDTDLVEYIKVVSHLTVRVTVRYVSEWRIPKVSGFPDAEYPCYIYRGECRHTVGTGMVYSVDIPDVSVGETCQCKKCLSSSTPERNFAILNIRTATHVVFDQLEGDHTTCHLFFDKGGTPYTPEGVVSLHGMSNVTSQVGKDTCEMQHFTHDLRLAMKLIQKVAQFHELSEKVFNKLPAIDSFPRQPYVLGKKPLLFIVSHPHGYSKLISLGYCTRIDQINTKVINCMYTTPTCPGSSGAGVFIPQKLKMPGPDVALPPSKETHAGTASELHGINYCPSDQDAPWIGTLVLKVAMLNKDMDTYDSMALARLDREHQGPLEAEYSYGGEADLHRHFEGCEKNLGHKNFIPVDDFSIEHLPVAYQETDLVEYIRVVSDLTVRMTVKHISDSRKAKVRGLNSMYPGYSDKGKDRITVGTGVVYSVDIPDVSVGETCQCKKCLPSSTPERNFAKLNIRTATHVVFDQLEGDHTTCHLFFDRGVTPGTCEGVVSLDGMSNVTSQVGKDTCEMQHFTHDLRLAKRLIQTLAQFHKLSDKVFNKLPVIEKVPQSKDAVKKPLLFIVAHPHGCSKQISLGYCKDLRPDEMNNEVINCIYNTPTCPGSSGAGVFIPHKLQIKEPDVALTPFKDIHVAVFGFPHAINYCRSDRDAPWIGTMDLKVAMLNTESWQDIFCCVEEKDLHKHYQSCQQNPGHKMFFPADKLCLESLHGDCRNKEILRLIQMVADLNVRVSVKYVSEARPETVPGTDLPYPWSANKRSKLMRVGTGWITDVFKYDNNPLNKTCDCKDCKASPSPKTQFAHILVRTPRHLVYDGLEVEQTICHLFFDSGETPDDCPGVVALTNVYDFHTRSMGLFEDLMVITYVIHDLKLASRLKRLIAIIRCGYFPRDKDIDEDASEVPDAITMKIIQEGILGFMVSHPHGCAKQICIDYKVEISATGGEDSQSQVRWKPCTGFSGTSMITVGCEHVFPFCGKMGVGSP